MIGLTRRITFRRLLYLLFFSIFCADHRRPCNHKINVTPLETSFSNKRLFAFQMFVCYVLSEFLPHGQPRKWRVHIFKRIAHSPITCISLHGEAWVFQDPSLLASCMQEKQARQRPTYPLYLKSRLQESRQLIVCKGASKGIGDILAKLWDSGIMVKDGRRYNNLWRYQGTRNAFAFFLFWKAIYIHGMDSSSLRHWRSRLWRPAFDRTSLTQIKNI